ncbi:hypothetical protein VIN01S_22090 [Vibrio inusitatus NBRC 102082]|uniref:Lipoprotein n=1 Tax=Vibrio inusitatus NBRC 102082 TaxID=1219070 RepID=A0A4Y3HWJ7_9VIBR|nr:hypothetical protein [Vibrio inusitatus]GEA51405.1 hypothetical protein VIN01S_22090 [Vibrio inusitatus NBRC 102082]
MKKLILIMVAAGLSGCGGSDSGDNGPTTPPPETLPPGSGLPILPPIPPELCDECEAIQPPLPDLPLVLPPGNGTEPLPPVEPGPCPECGEPVDPGVPEFPVEPPIEFSQEGQVCEKDAIAFNYQGNMGLYSIDRETIFNDCYRRDEGRIYHSVLYDANQDLVLSAYTTYYAQILGGISSTYYHVTYYNVEGAVTALVEHGIRHSLYDEERTRLHIKVDATTWDSYKIVEGEWEFLQTDDGPRGNVARQDRAKQGMEDMKSQFSPY